MKSEYITDLLKDKKMVILPGLGALSYTPGSPIPYTYNSFLKFNDGILAAYVSSKENISADEAGKKIETFVSGLISALDSGQEIIITNIGKLKKSAGGKIEFSSVNPGEKLEASAVTKPLTENKPAEKKSEEPVMPIEQPAEIKKEPDSKTQSDKKPEPKKEKIKPEPEKKIKKEKPIKEKSENPKRKKRLIFWIILLIILLGGAAAGYIFKDDIIAMYNEHFCKKEKTIVVEEPKEIIVEEPVDTTTFEIPLVEEPKKYTTGTTPGYYYIVIGCFSSRENAEMMIAKSNVKGYATVDMGIISSLNYVAAGSAPDMASAKEILNKAKNDFPSAWIMKR